MADEKPYDFSGMATVYDVKCNDGRIIGKGAFAHQDGQSVPLVWRHQHERNKNLNKADNEKGSPDPQKSADSKEQ